MRMLGTIAHTAYQITVFGWAEKYIVKIEARGLEQAYKFPQEAYDSWKDLESLFDEAMLEQVRQVFQLMASAMGASVARRST